jgi:hypothetical protein
MGAKGVGSGAQRVTSHKLARAGSGILGKDKILTSAALHIRGSCMLNGGEIIL